LAVDDYRINAQVRAVLVQRAVDMGKIEYGTTNRVIYIKGRLAPFMREEPEDAYDAKLQEAVMAKKLENVLRRLPGVRDVVFLLERVHKVGWRWRPR